MKREFFINIVFLLIANLLIKPFYLLWIEVEVNNIVGPNIYGTYAGVLSFCFIFQIIADPGLLYYNTTNIATDHNRLASQFRDMFGLKIFLGFLFGLAVLILAFAVGYGPKMWEIIPWIALNIFLISLILFLRSNVSAIGKYRWDSLFSILDKSLMILILVYMIYFAANRSSFGIMDFIYGQTIAYSISATVVLVFLIFQKVNILPRIDFKIFKRILIESLPFASIIFLMTIYTRIDSFMLERLLSDDAYQAGIYASAFRIFDAGNSFAYLFAVLLLPIFSNMVSKGQQVRDLVEASSKFLGSGIIVVSLVFMFYAIDIMSFFYPSDATTEYSQAFIFLMVALVPMALAYISGSFLTAINQLKLLNKIAIWGVVVNIVLNLILIQTHGATGAAIATAATQLTMTLIQWSFVYRKLDKKPSSTHIFRFVILIILTCVGSFLVASFSLLPLLINIILSIMIGLIIAFTLGTFQLDVLKVLLKHKRST